MNIWLLRTGEQLPIVNPDGRLMRMGMLAEELSNRGHNVIWFSSTFNHFTKEQEYNKDTIVKVKDNYITFNNEEWRILSIEKDGTMKIINLKKLLKNKISLKPQVDIVKVVLLN